MDSHWRGWQSVVAWGQMSQPLKVGTVSLSSGYFVPLSAKAGKDTFGRRGRLTRTQLRLHCRLKLIEAG
eukprot:IDg16974t1